MDVKNIESICILYIYISIHVCISLRHMSQLTNKLKIQNVVMSA